MRGSFVIGLSFLVMLLTIQPATAATTYISIGTGGTGGVYYPYGGGLAEIWTKHVPGVKAVAEVTGASVENTKLCSRGETLVGEVMGDVAYQGYHGQGKFKGKKQKVNAMFMMYPNVYHIVALKKSGIKTLADLKGKRISIGAPGSGTAFKTDLVFKALGLTDFEPYRLSFVENSNALRDGTIDVGVWSVAAPTSSIMDLATTHEITIIPFDDASIKKVLDQHQYYSDYELAGGTYKGVDEPIKTLSVWNVVICNRDMSEEMVYNLVKTVYENQDYLIKIHPFAKNTTPENTIKHSPIPLHPGTIKYLKEKGIEIPERLMPE